MLLFNLCWKSKIAISMSKLQFLMKMLGIKNCNFDIGIVIFWQDSILGFRLNVCLQQGDASWPNKEFWSLIRKLSKYRTLVPHKQRCWGAKWPNARMNYNQWRKALLETLHTKKKMSKKTDIHGFEHIELPAKLLDCLLRSNKATSINQFKL